MGASRNELEVLYREEEHPDVKERLLLILRVEGDGMVPARVAKELHRSRPWTSLWLARYREEGVDGLKDKPRSGRPPKLTEEGQMEIRREVSSREQGGTNDQVGPASRGKGKGKVPFPPVLPLVPRGGLKGKGPQGGPVNPAPIGE